MTKEQTPEDITQLLREAGVGGYELMTREELLECIQAHDAHHQEHHERDERYIDLLKKTHDALIPFFLAWQETKPIEDFYNAIEKSTKLSSFGSTVRQHVMEAKVSFNGWQKLNDTFSAIDKLLEETK